MLPIGPLMIEHRVIEKFLRHMDARLAGVQGSEAHGLALIAQGVDFFRTYADRSHHGKEENILFRELAKKSLPETLRQIMQELVQEHVLGRKLVGNLAAARERLQAGVSGAADELRASWRALRDFYPRHIAKEDQHFFLPGMEYFTRAEQDAMLAEGFVLDQELFHERYRDWVEQLASPPDRR